MVVQETMCFALLLVQNSEVNYSQFSRQCFTPMVLVVVLLLKVLESLSCNC